MEKMTRIEYFLKGVEKIKSLGYKCFQPKGKETYTFCEITDGKNIGYMQVGDYGDCFNFGTVSKYGSQYRIINPNEDNKYFQYEFDIEDITKEVIELTFKEFPNWQTNDHRKVTKWSSWEDFAKNSLDAKIYKEFIEL